MAKRRKEKVSVSFHHMMRRDEDSKGDDLHPISQEDFDLLLDRIEHQPAVDMTNEDVKRQVRMGAIVPFFKFERRSNQLAFAKFEAAYSGHSFKNSDFGKIERDSINQREFNCLLYLSKDGKLFVGSQYLGNYGSYFDLRNGITRLLPQASTVVDFVYRDDSFTLADARPKEIQIDVTNEADVLHQDNVLGKRSAIVLKRTRKGDEWESEAKRKILPLFQTKAEDRAEKLSKTLNELGLFSVEQGEIVNGKMILEVGKGQQTVYLFEPLNFATRFPLDVPLNKDGHPKLKPVRNAMEFVFTQQILKKVGP